MAIIDYDSLINPMTKGMTKKQLAALKEENNKRFYSGIYAPDVVADPTYYKRHKAELAEEQE